MNIPFKPSQQQIWDRFIPKWLQQALTIQAVMKHVLAGDYNAAMGPSKEMLVKIKGEHRCSALKAMAIALKPIQAQDPSGKLTREQQNCIIAAALDLAELEDDILGGRERGIILPKPGRN